MRSFVPALLLSAALLGSVRADTYLNPSGIPLGGTAAFAVSVNPPAFPDSLLVWQETPEGAVSYPNGLQQADLVKRLLMYGHSSSDKADIPYGDVEGLWYESVWDPTNRVWLKDWHLSPAYVGFFLHYNPHPFHR